MIPGFMLIVGFLQAEVDDAQDDRREDDPEELVPVEEGEAEEYRCSARVDMWEAEREIGDGEKSPDGGTLFVCLFRCACLHYWLL